LSLTGEGVEWFSNMANGNGNSGGGLLHRLFGRPAPTLGCEISSGGITVGRWSPGASQLNTAAWRPLPEGAIDPTPLRENLSQRERVREALAGCLEALGLGALRAAEAHSGTDIALVIPDQSARLFVLDFDSLPRGTSEALQLVRWRLKKSVPFDIDSSVISFTAHRREAGWQVISVVTPQAIVHEYEQLLASVGLSVSRITLSSLAALALLPEADAGSTLLVKMNFPSVTTAIVHGEDLALFRTAAINADGAGEASPEAVFETIYPAFAYFQDTFGRALDRVYVCGLGEMTPGIMESIATEMQVPAQLLLTGSDLAAATSAGWSRPDAERYSAALAGLLRE